MILHVWVDPVNNLDRYFSKQDHGIAKTLNTLKVRTPRALELFLFAEHSSSYGRYFLSWLEFQYFQISSFQWQTICIYITPNKTFHPHAPKLFGVSYKD